MVEEWSSRGVHSSTPATWATVLLGLFAHLQFSAFYVIIIASLIPVF